MSLKDRWAKAEIGNETGGNDFIALKPDNYICKIVAVENDEVKEYFKISFDIATGEFKDHYKEQHERFNGDWPYNAVMYFSYKEANMNRFRTNIDIIERSNAGYNFEKSNFDEKSLIGKLFVQPFLSTEIPQPDLQDNPKVIVKPNGFIRSVTSFKAGEVPPVKLDVVKLSGAYDLDRWAKRDKVTPTAAAVTPKVEPSDLPF